MQGALGDDRPRYLRASREAGLGKSRQKDQCPLSIIAHACLELQHSLGAAMAHHTIDVTYDRCMR
jgi:hypothetical protein